MELALGHIGSDTPIHLSFDVDALDPQWAPSTGTPVRGGLTLREGDFIAECVHETGSLIAMDLVRTLPRDLSVSVVHGSAFEMLTCSLSFFCLGRGKPQLGDIGRQRDDTRRLLAGEVRAGRYPFII